MLVNSSELECYKKYKLFAVKYSTKINFSQVTKIRQTSTKFKRTSGKFMLGTFEL